MRSAVTSLPLVLGLHVLVIQVRAIDQAVDLQQIADLSAQIDLKSALTDWQQDNGAHLRLPATHPHSLHSPASPHVSTDTLSPPRPSPSSAQAWRADLSGGPPLTGHRQLRSVPGPDTGRSAASLPQGSSPYTQGHPVPDPALPLTYQRSQSVGLRSGQGKETAAAEERPPAASNRGWRSKSPKPREDLPPSRKKGTLEDPKVIHMSAKKFSRLEEELAQRQQEEPEHKLYHQDLLLRRLKALRHAHRHGQQYRPPLGVGEKEEVEQEEVDGWGEELRIRGQLAEKALQNGLKKQSERRAHPDPNRPLTIMERIHRDAQEILKRRALEKGHKKGGQKDGAGKDRKSSAGPVQRVVQSHSAVPADGPAKVPDRPESKAEAAAASPASVLRDLMAGGGVPVSSKQRRKRKGHSRALARVLKKQKRLF